MAASNTVGQADKSLAVRCVRADERRQRRGEDVDDEDHTRLLDEFLAEVLDAGEVPRLPSFLGEEWEPLAAVIGDVLRRFDPTMVIEVTRSDDSECYVQFARDDESIRVELVSNEFLESQQLPADRVSLLLELGWMPPAENVSPNFSRTFADPEVSQLPWLVLQTLHDVYDAELQDTWAVMPPELLDTEGVYLDDDSAPVVEPWEITYLEGPAPLDSAGTGKPGSIAGSAEGAAAEARDPGSDVSEAQVRATFQMPKAVTILGRSSSVTNSFVNSIIPVITPTMDEIQRALEILGMTHAVTCCYCGDPWTEWDHLRPIVIDKAPTGYISEIHNLVPACGKCNQSKGNRPWREWMLGDAARSPKTRGIHDLKERAARLDAYEHWKTPTQLDFAAIVGAAEWGTYWGRWKALLEQMRTATEHATRIRAQIAATYAGHAPVTTGLPHNSESAANDGESFTPADGWTVVGPEETAGPIPKNRAVLEAVRACIAVGISPDSLAPLLGPTNFRAVVGNPVGEELWRAFADTHGKTEQHRRLWFLDTPIQADGYTWILANNVWGPRTYQLFKELVTLAGGIVTVIQPNGFKVRPHGTGEGIKVLKPGEPVSPKRPIPQRSSTARESNESRRRPAAAHATPPTASGDSDSSSITGWTREDRETIDRLAGTEPRWRGIRQPGPGFGRFTLAVAMELTARGFHVRPLAADELFDGALAELAPAELLATNGQRRIFAFTNDYGRSEQRVWARLKERIGPYPESRELDRALVEFSVHGPFEREVTRRDGQVWVTIMVRLDDVATALLDLDNVAGGLAVQLSSAGKAT